MIQWQQVLVLQESAAVSNGPGRPIMRVLVFPGERPPPFASPRVVISSQLGAAGNIFLSCPHQPEEMHVWTPRLEGHVLQRDGDGLLCRGRGRARLSGRAQGSYSQLCLFVEETRFEAWTLEKVLCDLQGQLQYRFAQCLAGCSWSPWSQ